MRTRQRRTRKGDCRKMNVQGFRFAASVLLVVPTHSLLPMPNSPCSSYPLCTTHYSLFATHSDFAPHYTLEDHLC